MARFFSVATVATVLASSVCGTVATPQAAACPTTTSFSWCDHSKTPEERAKLIVSNLTKEEKAGLFINTAQGVSRINWPAYNWWSEALHGVARDGLATSFPQICGVAASYNQTLWNAIGEVTSTEGRGKNNNVGGHMYQGLTFWAPNVNIFRDPRWGRGEETPGEDPTINGNYAKQFVSGMQGDESSGFLKVSACLKHFAAYNEETNRQSFPAVVTAQDMEDTYLPAFEAGVTEGKASGIMCSYNAETYGEGIYGPGSDAQHGAIPSCANKGILNGLARAKWGFDGYITSDCGAVSDVQNQHGYTPNTSTTVNAVFSAGMDTDCGGYMGSKAMTDLLDDANIASLGDTALLHLFTVQFRLGWGTPDSVVPWATYNASVVNTQAHQDLALSAAEQSLVLLKNTDGVGKLPWSKEAVKTVAVIGRNADATQNMLGNYFGTPPYIVSPKDGLGKYATTSYADGTDIDAAVKLVATVDAVVLVVGLFSEGEKPADEAEGHDRTSLLLPGNQNDLIAAVATAAAAAKKPVTVVTMGGGPVDVTNVKNNSAIQALIWCGYPGQSGGDAIANAIFGATNTFGKLTLTWYPQEFTSQVSIMDMGMRPNKTSGNPGRTYRFYTGTPVFKFGEGLSYTTFESKLHAPRTVDLLTIHSECDRSILRKDTSVVASVDVAVKNTGTREGDEIVQVFVAPPNAGVDGTPLQWLVAFDRVKLAQGEQTTVSVDIKSHHFTYADVNGQRTAQAGVWKMWLGADQTDLQTFTVV